MRLFMLSVLFISLYIYHAGFGQAPGANVPNPYAVSTYECAGLYWKTLESGPCVVRYKEESSTIWKDGLELTYDSRDGEYRGSIIDLAPNTRYQVELSNNATKTELAFKTRYDQYPIGKTTILPEGESDHTIVISESGTADAYHLVTVPGNSRSVLNVKNVYDYGVEIDADYVIIRGVEIRNAKIDGIRIKENRHDIVIEQCYITFWGRMGGPITYGNLEGSTDSGIYA